MSYMGRGGAFALDAPAIGAHADRQQSATSSSPRQFRLFPTVPFEGSSGDNSTVQSLTSNSTLDSNLERSLDEAAARKGMLEQNSYFPDFNNDAGGFNLDDPEEMQKNDPLATQIWRLYSKAKTQLPNAERMENLTWRMMAMNMRRAELDRNKGYGRRHVTLAPCACNSRTPLLTNLLFLQSRIPSPDDAAASRGGEQRETSAEERTQWNCTIAEVDRPAGAANADTCSGCHELG